MSPPEHIGAEFGAGAFFAGGGIALTVGALRYPLGTASAMGPGYFPLILGILLMLIGGAILARILPALLRAGLVNVLPKPAFGPRMRSFVAITGAVVLFGMLLRPLGLLVAVPVLVGVSSLAGGTPGFVRVAVTSIVLTLVVYLIFVLGIGVRMPLLPGGGSWN